jgi:hypothetical protein
MHFIVLSHAISSDVKCAQRRRQKKREQGERMRQRARKVLLIQYIARSKSKPKDKQENCRGAGCLFQQAGII